MRVQRFRPVGIPTRFFRCFLAVVSFLAVLGAAGCSDDKKPTAGPNGQFSPGDDPILGVILSDGFGRAVSTVGGTPVGTLSLLDGESASFTVDVFTLSAIFHPQEAGRLLSVTVEIADSTIAAAAVLSADTTTTLRLRGLRPGNSAIRIAIGSPETSLYTSPWIPVLVSRRGEVSGMTVWTRGRTILYQEFGTPGPALFLNRGDILDSLRLEFISGGEGPPGIIPDSLLGENVRIQFGATPMGVLRVTAYDGRPFRFRVEALESGQVELKVRLVRDGGVIYQSLGITVRVVPPDPEWWSGFGPGNAPNGPVRRMVVYRDRLVLAGDFTQVGTLPAGGIASWDGADWSNSFHHLDGLQWLLTDGDILVAGGPDLGFYRWDGAEWVAFAPGNPGAVAAALFHGEIVIAGDREFGIEVWRDGNWQTIASGPRTYPYALAVCGDTLYTAAERLEYTMMFQSAIVAVVAGGALVPIYRVGGQDNSSSDISHLKGIGDFLVAAWDFGAPGGYSDGIVRWIRGTRPRDISRDQNLWVRGSAMVGAGLYVADRQSVLVDEGVGLRSFATAGGGEIFDAESFQGSLYVCGSFTSLQGVPSYRLGRWTP